ncbi:MAG: hypothetical protein JOS17DRAFT_4086 [Linnemannia elongata]|nr:MAG: hypothetical protein JOS17DRAFT_4086 [Linnemannia elongata]
MQEERGLQTFLGDRMEKEGRYCRLLFFFVSIGKCMKNKRTTMALVGGMVKSRRFDQDPQQQGKRKRQPKQPTPPPLHLNSRKMDSKYGRIEKEGERMVVRCALRIEKKYGVNLKRRFKTNDLQEKSHMTGIALFLFLVVFNPLLRYRLPLFAVSHKRRGREIDEGDERGTHIHPSSAPCTIQRSQRLNRSPMHNAVC